jgi:hypothetical protein
MKQTSLAKEFAPGMCNNMHHCIGVSWSRLGIHDSFAQLFNNNLSDARFQLDSSLQNNLSQIPHFSEFSIGFATKTCIDVSDNEG